MELPSGTVTFLFTDIQGSTRLLHSLGDRYVDGLAQHSEIIEGAVEGNRGIVVNTEGDAYFCVFREASDAAVAAVSILLGLSTHDWPPDSEFRVRIGFHTGEGILGAADYVGMDVHRAARISAAGHGGQALLSADSQTLVADHLPDGVTLNDLGSGDRPRVLVALLRLLENVAASATTEARRAAVAHQIRLITEDAKRRIQPATDLSPVLAMADNTAFAARHGKVNHT